jgi:UDP:flavonoid glycosyltransferase YjiC (YdhE family)
MHGVPAVLHLWGPVGPAETDPTVQILPNYNNDILRKLGVREQRTEMVKYVIDPCPADLEPPVGQARRIPVRYVPYNGPGEAPAWVLDEPARPRVCVVWGHTLSRFGPNAFLVPDILAALAEEDLDVLVAVHPRDAEHLGPVPANARILERFPINLLLPRCDAVVHHGGAGCVMSAVAAGTPQLAVPFESEQDANGVRVAAAGAGLRLRAKTVTGGQIRESVLRLLREPSFAENAARLRDDLARRPSPADAVAVLEEIARTGEPPAVIDWAAAPPVPQTAGAR